MTLRKNIDGDSEKGIDCDSVNVSGTMIRDITKTLTLRTTVATVNDNDRANSNNNYRSKDFEHIQL